VADGFARLVAGDYEVGDDDGASIDERIARNSMLVLELDNRIERCTRRFAPGTRQLSYRRVNSCSLSFEVCHVRHYSASHRDIVVKSLGKQTRGEAMIASSGSR
jgi:hypothetical protein